MFLLKYWALIIVHLKIVVQFVTRYAIISNQSYKRDVKGKLTIPSFLIKETDKEIRNVFNELGSTIFSIPDINCALGVMILAEICDLNKFEILD